RFSLFFSSRRRHTRFSRDWSSDVCSSDLASLALSLTQLEKDPVTLELLISAQFDTGHYQRITLTDPNNQAVINRVFNQTTEPDRSEERRVGKSIDLEGCRMTTSKPSTIIV